MHEGSALTTEQAMRRAMRLLAIRGRSCHEISERLAGAGYGTEVIEKVVLRLGEVGLLDDGKFAAECLRQAVDRGKSAEWIRRDLLQRGVLEPVIEVAIDEAGIGDSEYDRALQVAGRRLAGMPGLPSARAYGRLMRYLCSKGYDPELAGEVSRTIAGI
jgi:regulatory protein